MFAGDHTEFPPGQMEAAVLSGVRAAAEVFFDQDLTKTRGVKYNDEPEEEKEEESATIEDRKEKVHDEVGGSTSAHTNLGRREAKYRPQSLFVPELIGW